MTFEQPNNEIPSDKTDKEFQYWFKEYDDALRAHNLFFLAKGCSEDAQNFWIKFKKTVKPAGEFYKQGASWEDCFQAMLNEAEEWDGEQPKALELNDAWTKEDIIDLNARGSAAYPEIKYAVIQRKALNDPKALTEEERQYFFDNIKEDDYELAADIKKLWESSKK